jgi:hypothetical protein
MKPASPDRCNGILTMRAEPMRRVVERLEAPDLHTQGAAVLPPAGGLAVASQPSLEQRHTAALGCRTSEVALYTLCQVARIEEPRLAADTSQEQVDHLLCKATALVAELQPTTATETLLAAQMVGTHRLAMHYMSLALLQTDSTLTDACVLRASRMMRVFTDQLEAMAKLKGKSGQQRVVVEHVTVHEGGQAIVGAVASTKIMGS